MECTLGRGRMAAMVKLLTIGCFPETSAEEAIHEKIAVQTICRQFNDADEANLLEEDDMHVFDSRPMTDNLHLVCCNACKKPIKASRYAAHAERCRPLSPMEDAALVLDGGAGHKKPPRKGMQSLEQTNDNNGTTIGWQEKYESKECNNVAGSESNFDGQIGFLSSPSGEAQNAPVPLATKIYHSQGNQRLRLALGLLYHGASAKEHCHDSKSSELTQDETMMSSQILSPSESLHMIHNDGASQKILAQRSELCLETSGGFTSAMSLSNQFRENSFPKPGLQVAAAPVGMMKVRYHSQPYSYSGKTGCDSTSTPIPPCLNKCS